QRRGQKSHLLNRTSSRAARCLTAPSSVEESCCAEHGAPLGRSQPGRLYAEAKRRSGWWTKATPARRTSGPMVACESANGRWASTEPVGGRCSICACWRAVFDLFGGRLDPRHQLPCWWV